MTLTTFYQDRNRARERVAMLEHQADAFSRKGKTVPAAALARQARIIQYLWCLTQCDDVNLVRNLTTFKGMQISANLSRRIKRFTRSD